jgi:hypothetical protein
MSRYGSHACSSPLPNLQTWQLSASNHTDRASSVLSWRSLGPPTPTPLWTGTPGTARTFDKFGSFTPGTHIPIISEPEARAMNPDYFLVLPWHFKEGIIAREQQFLAEGGKFIFPFPEIEII